MVIATHILLLQLFESNFPFIREMASLAATIWQLCSSSTSTTYSSTYNHSDYFTYKAQMSQVLNFSNTIQKI